MYACVYIYPSGADPGLFERGGVQIRSTSKKGGPDGGPILGLMLKSLHRGTKGGGPDPLDPPLDPLLVHACTILCEVYIQACMLP